MVEVVYFAESLDLGPLLDLLLTHTLGNFSGVAIDASHEGMSVRFLRCTFIIVLQPK